MLKTFPASASACPSLCFRQLKHMERTDVEEPPLAPSLAEEPPPPRLAAAVRRALADVPDLLLVRVEIGRWEAATGRGVVLLVPMDARDAADERSALQDELHALLRARLPDMAPTLPPVVIPPLHDEALPWDAAALDAEPDSAWLQSPLLPAVRKQMLDGGAATIMAAHSNVCAVFAGPKRKGRRWTSDAAVTVVVLTKGFIPSGEQRLDETCPGAPVDVVEGHTVPYTANVYSVVRPSERDPLAGGVSLGRSPTDPKTPAGTLGLIVEHATTGALYGLASSHVAGKVGDTVFAPAACDVKNSERPTPPVGVVARSDLGEPYTVTLRDGQAVRTTVDAALIELSVDGALVTPAELPYRKQEDGEALPAHVSPGASGVWTLNDAIWGDVRQPNVIKVGRSTGTTVSKLHDGDLRGSLYRVSFTEPADPSEPKVLPGLYLVPSGPFHARKPFARAGDSGAIVQVVGPGVSQPRVAGMVLGGLLLENGLYRYTIVAPIDPILENFGVRLRG